jgi:hypothetical protein
MKSIISYPERGNWGSSKWRGNTSGYVIKDLIEHFQPKLFVDVCEGSGTSGDVCREMGIDYVGLDLHKGNDFTRDFVLSQLSRPADMVFSHPPYHTMIPYSGNMWGNGAVDGDTSHCDSVDEFIEKSQVMLLNQREATRAGGIYTTLIGDMRKNGTFRSFQADFIKMMPSSELVSVVVKAQHNCWSDNRQYSGNFVPIHHEYLLLWKRSEQTIFQIAYDKAIEFRKQTAATWRSVIRIALMKHGGRATLNNIYAAVEKIAGEMIAKNQHWQAKVRQVLQRHFENVQRGVWAVA